MPRGKVSPGTNPSDGGRAKSAVASSSFQITNFVSPVEQPQYVLPLISSTVYPAYADVDYTPQDVQVTVGKNTYTITVAVDDKG